MFAVAAALLLAATVASAQAASHPASALVAKKKKCKRGRHLVTRKVRRHGRKVKIKVCVKNKRNASGPTTRPVPGHTIAPAYCTYSYGSPDIQVEAPNMAPADPGARESVGYQATLYWSSSSAGPWHQWQDGPFKWRYVGPNTYGIWYFQNGAVDGDNGTTHFSPQSGFYWRTAVHYWWYATAPPDGHAVSTAYEWILSSVTEGFPASYTVTADSCSY